MQLEFTEESLITCNWDMLRSLGWNLKGELHRFYASKSVYICWGERLHMWKQSCVKPFEPPEESAQNLINYLKWCNLSRCWLVLKKKMKRSGVLPDLPKSLTELSAVELHYEKCTHQFLTRKMKVCYKKDAVPDSAPLILMLRFTVQYSPTTTLCNRSAVLT